MLPPRDSPEFPAALKAAREAAGLTRRGLAQLAGISRSTVLNIESPESNKYRTPTRETYIAICLALGFELPAEYLAARPQILPPRNSPEFPAALKAAREEKSLKFAELGRRASVDGSLIRRYEYERSNPRFLVPSEKSYEALCHALHYLPPVSREHIILSEASVTALCNELSDRLIKSGSSITLPLPDVSAPIQTPKVAPASNLLRPDVSITGFPTRRVEDEERTQLWADLETWGMTLHSPTASNVWAVTEMCQVARVPYVVIAAKDSTGAIRSVAVGRADALKQNFIESYAPRDVTIEVVETFSGHETSGNPIVYVANIIHTKPDSQATQPTSHWFPPVQEGDSDD